MVGGHKWGGVFFAGALRGVALEGNRKDSCYAILEGPSKKTSHHICSDVTELKKSYCGWMKSNGLKARPGFCGECFFMLRAFMRP